MPDRPKVQKARIIKVANPSKVTVCHFNPNELSLTRTIDWTEKTSIGNDASQLMFGGGQAEDLTIPLLFDTTDTGQDVRDSYKDLLEMANIDPDLISMLTDLGEPPLCRFEWGKLLSFTAVITKISQKFIMFKDDGTPLRAEVSVTFKQYHEKLGPQNPTTRSQARSTWVVQQGESLDWIAYKEYRDPACWRHIAETNDLDNPKDLEPGRILKLVPLP